jgi:hypothetical protein
MIASRLTATYPNTERYLLDPRFQRRKPVKMALFEPAGNHDADVTARGLEICYN